MVAEVQSDMPPRPRPGPLGLWDLLVGPGATSGENTLIVAASLLGAAAAAARLAEHGASGWLIAIGAALGLDIIGGAVANATSATKLWYHRPGATTRRHVLFLLPHAAHVALEAWLFRNGDWGYFAAVACGLTVAAAIVMATPTRLKRPVAIGLTLAAMGGWYYALGPTPGLEWFVPGLLLKLIAGHLVPVGKP